jgi:hypothetical protein
VLVVQALPARARSRAWEMSIGPLLGRSGCRPLGTATQYLYCYLPGSAALVDACFVSLSRKSAH